MDIDAIEFGEDYRKRIYHALRQTDYLLVLIGTRWLGPTAGGRNRINDASDPVRMEVERALEIGLRVVPILLEHTPMPGPEDLPETLGELPFLNAADISTGREFDSQIERIIRFINRTFAETEARREREAQEQQQELGEMPGGGSAEPNIAASVQPNRALLIVAGILAAALVLFGGAFALLQRTSPPVVAIATARPATRPQQPVSQPIRQTASVPASHPVPATTQPTLQPKSQPTPQPPPAPTSQPARDPLVATTLAHAKASDVDAAGSTTKWFLGADHNLWLEQGGSGDVHPARKHVDGNVLGFQDLNATTAVILGTDRNLWLEHGPFGTIPPRREQIDGPVLAFQALSDSAVLILGLDHNLWFEHGPFGSVPPPREQIDGNVLEFRALNASSVLVLGLDRNLWLEHGPFGSVPPRREHLDGNALPVGNP